MTSPPATMPSPAPPEAALLALERLLLEGGLRSSFIAIFGGSLFDTADDTPRGDGFGIDDLLERRRIVCIDRALLAPIDDSLPDRPERERYRHNLARKLAARQHAWLRVIEDAGEAQAGALRSLASQLREASRHAGAGAVRRTLVILVFTKEMEPESREIVREIRDDVPGVARVYLMAHRLQPADRGSRAITAHAVWPVCVARLLAVRSILPAHEQGSAGVAQNDADVGTETILVNQVHVGTPERQPDSSTTGRDPPRRARSPPFRVDSGASRAGQAGPPCHRAHVLRCPY